MLTSQTITYPSAAVDKQISAEIWMPEGTPKAVLQIAHGMCEYIDRYLPTIHRLCQEGYIVCGNDHLGHGKTAALNGDPLGWFGDTKQSRVLVEDVHSLTKIMQSRFPDLPYLLIAHSMGSFIGRICIGMYPDSYVGAAILGTAGPGGAVDMGIMLARHIIRTKGPRYISPMISGMLKKRNLSGLPDLPGPHDWISRDPAVVAAYTNDPDCNYVFSAAAFEDLFVLMKECNAPGWYIALPCDFPLWIASGDQDPVGEFGVGVSAVYQKLLSTGHTNVELKMYLQARHELHNELEKGQFWDDMIQWIQKII